jgi:hypothetical protein
LVFVGVDGCFLLIAILITNTQNREVIMEFIRILEALIGFILVITIITQIIVPLWNNMPIFPLFNSSRKDLEKGLKTVHDLEEQQRLADELRIRTEKLLHYKHKE